MKCIGIVTDGNTSLEIFLKRNLEAIFRGYVKINNYYFKDLKEGDIIKDDLVLVMIKERALKVNEYVLDSKNIVTINRTIREEEVYKIFSIPEKTDVLVVNDNTETTLEMVSLLYQLGINHLNLIPYDENKDYTEINIAITPGERRKVPSYIEEIIDVGDRCIDVSTFITIMSKLNLDKKEIKKRLIKYLEKVVSLHNGIKNKYKELYIKNEDLDSIINLSKDGIILTSKDGKIFVYNKSFLKIFDLKDDIKGWKIKDLFEDDMKKLLEQDEIKDEVFKFKNKYVNANKRNIIHFGQKTGMYFNIQEITYIKQLEQNLSKKLREKGQIARYKFEDIKTISSNMKDSIRLANKIANSELTVLITGESGTGKEVFAQSIHNASPRSKQPFVAVNCAAMPENLLESELFGYEGGAFTGALKEGKRGLFEQAHNGTIFLDEIGDMPIHLQTKLLRVLQERQVMRVGSDKVIDIDVRVIAATNRNLLKRIREGKFREDLYYRLNVLPINIPSLKERKEDIILLLVHFMEEKIKLTEGVQMVLKRYNWPGNIRELKNVASYISLMCENNTAEIKDLPFYLMNVEEDFDYEIKVLENKCCYEKAVEIINIVYNHNQLGKSIGRSNLVKLLNDIDIFITEGETRRILSVLNDLKLISSSVGRKGSEITVKGTKFLNKVYY